MKKTNKSIKKKLSYLSKRYYLLEKVSSFIEGLVDYFIKYRTLTNKQYEALNKIFQNVTDRVKRSKRKHYYKYYSSDFYDTYNFK